MTTIKVNTRYDSKRIVQELEFKPEPQHSLSGKGVESLSYRVVELAEAGAKQALKDLGYMDQRESSALKLEVELLQGTIENLKTKLLGLRT